MPITMHRSYLLLRGALLPLLAVLILGCRTTGGSRKFPTDIRVPGDGDPIDRAIWYDAESWREHGMPDQYWKVNWLVPLNFSRKEAAFDDPQQLTVGSMVYNGLGAPLLFMPLRFKLSKYVYTPDSDEPAQGDWGSWTLFWASDGQVGGGIPGREVHAVGIPLFYGNFSVKEGENYTRVVNTLWSLGPAYATFHAEAERSGDVATSAANRSVDMTSFAPIAATGAPGALLWWDFTVRSRGTERMTRLDAHGPLGGMLGVLQSYSEEDTKRDFLRLYLLGALWRDQGDHKTDDPASRNGAHGPLWAMFGWGQKNGRPAVRLFFVPIPVGGMKSTT